jgi:hypothetical protein
MKISLGPFTLIRTRDLQEHKENISLLVENVRLLREQCALLKTIAAQKDRAAVLDLVSSDLVSKWLN